MINKFTNNNIKPAWYNCYYLKITIFNINIIYKILYYFFSFFVYNFLIYYKHI